MIARRLLLVDGTQLFYRSFFGIRGLSTRAGQPTNAVYGFVRGIHQLIDVWTPSHIAVAWDGGVPPARLALLPDYKAQRPPMPDDLRRQFEPVSEFLQRAGIPLIRLDHEEADDILASLVRQAKPDAEDIMIVTADKDLYQLVADQAVMVSWGKDDKRIDRHAVFEKTGVYPEQIVDWLALTGDAVDNIPGVEGMGPKTASKLLTQFGSLAALWPRLAEVQSSRIHDRLLASRGTIERNLSLVRLQDTITCFPGWESLAVRPEEQAMMRPFYSRMEFHSLLKGCDQGELF
jgi:DNA polymerase I